MDQHYWAYLIEHMKNYGIEFETGLTDLEIESIESKYQFIFPPDLRQFLQVALPVSHHFPNWRKNSGEVFLHMKEWILEGIYFDIERNNFWWDVWGAKPDNLAEAFQVAEREIAKAPVMIPVNSHQFIPAEPHLPGNPLFSIYQTDIIYMGHDLASYIIETFWTMRLENPAWVAKSPRPIRFWGELIDQLDKEYREDLAKQQWDIHLLFYKYIGRYFYNRRIK